MISKLNDNKIKASELCISAVGYIPNVAVVRNVKLNYVKDSEGKNTNVIESTRLTCIDPETFVTFSLKTIGARVFITPEAVAESEEHIYIDIPVDETIIKPYAIEYGTAKVSIIAPYVKLRTS